jgi:ABC-type nitrate/sulfonate/bicarbonate transport system substrate-binding protein/outer membrane protein OmpA-like peptidoglycan-associated protein
MKLTKALLFAGALLAVGLLSSGAAAQEKFSKLVGPVKVGDVKSTDTYEVPFLTWGGDVAAFHANGGLETKDGSIFQKQGLKLKFTKGDDFVAQVRAYVSGQTPFLRGTFSQLGQAAEVLGAEPRTQPVVFLQLTWSAGDHMVARPTCKTLNDLKGKTIALQSGGPHVGMLDDILRTAGLKWKDVRVIWTKDVTGKDGPAEKFRKDPAVDACFVISPDMQGLTGGLDKRGSGAEGTVKDSSVLVSTVTMKRSIADVYACRKDFYDKNKDTIAKFAAGYLKGSDELLDFKVRAAKDKDAAAKYKGILKLAVEVFGKDVLANEVEADGLISDALFVGLPGNRAFFQDKGNLSGFQAKMDAALALDLGDGPVGKGVAFLPPDFDYDKLDQAAGGIKGKAGPGISDKAEADKLIFTFIVTFDQNQSEFSEREYAREFKRAGELASLFGNALVVVRGHCDPTKCLNEFEKAGLEKKVLTREGKKYKLKDGTIIDLDSPKDMKRIADIIAKEDFTNTSVDPKSTLTLCEKLAQDRAIAVAESVQRFADGKGYTMDKNQIKPTGLSILEPIVPRPRTAEEAAKNRRVEFSIFSVKPREQDPAQGVQYDF